MAPRKKNTPPMAITGLAPNLSVAIPVKGARSAPVILAIEYPSVIVAGLQPRPCSNGTIRTPKACRIDPPAIWMMAAITIMIQA